MLSYPHRIVTRLLDLIFPYRCLGCGVHLDKKYLCGECAAAIPIRIRLECIGCRRTSPGGLTCDECQKEYCLKRIFVVSEYHHPTVAALVKALKYKFIPEASAPLIDLAGRFVQDQSALHRIGFAGEDFTVMPIPLHPRRENWRGFNQSRLLARGLAQRYRLKYSEGLTRTMHLAPQASIKNRAERLDHVKQAYVCSDPHMVAGRNILLVDDVCTTGATLNECARVLIHAGAVSVSALVIARG